MLLGSISEPGTWLCMEYTNIEQLSNIKLS